MFESLIFSLEQSGYAVSTPQTFKGFLASQDLRTSKRTPEIISINGISDLQPELRENSYTILRLGIPDDAKTTQFSLVKLASLSDGFFLDQPIFDSAVIGNFIPETSLRSLYPYHLLPKLMIFITQPCAQFGHTGRSSKHRSWDQVRICSWREYLPYV